MNRPTPDIDPKKELAGTYRALLPVFAVIALGLGLVWYVGRQTPQTRQGQDLASRLRGGVESLGQVDASLRTYVEAKAIDTGLSEPRGIAVGQDGRLYVVGDKTAKVFDITGKELLSADLAAEPYCVAADASGVTYIGFVDHVEVFGPDLRLESQWAPPAAKAYITCVTVAKEDVWVADAGNRVIHRFDRSGAIRGQVGATDRQRGREGLLVPSPHLDVPVNADGTLLVNNPGLRKVQRYSPEGELMGEWGSAGQTIGGFCGCCNPTDLALLPDGSVVTSEKGLLRVKVHDPRGNLTAVVAAPADFSKANDSLDLATTAEGDVLVLDRAAKQVRVFMPRADTTGAEGGS